MDISSARATLELIADVLPTGTLTTGAVQIGLPRITVDLSDCDVVYAVRLQAGNGATAGLDLLPATFTGAAAGTLQVETATAAGTASASGNVAVVISGGWNAAANKTVNVAITSGDTASTWAGKVRAALAADADISTYFTVGGSTTAIVLTQKTADGNAGNFNISLDNGTPSPGITTAATSANTTAGVGRVVWTDADGNDFEGTALPDIDLIKGLAIQCSEGVGFFYSGAYSFLEVVGTGNVPGTMILTAEGAGSPWDDSVTVQAARPTDLTITVFGVAG